MVVISHFSRTIIHDIWIKRHATVCEQWDIHSGHSIIAACLIIGANKRILLIFITLYFKHPWSSFGSSGHRHCELISVKFIGSQFWSFDLVVLTLLLGHHNTQCGDVIMSAMASQYTGVSIVCSTVCWGTYQRKPQSSASLPFVREIHLSPVVSPHKGQWRGKCFHGWRHHGCRIDFGHIV